LCRHRRQGLEPATTFETAGTAAMQDGAELVVAIQDGAELVAACPTVCKLA
jgi:hypothetical protein